MVIIDTVINTLLGGLTLDPAGMHCPSWDDAFVSSFIICRSHLLDSKQSIEWLRERTEHLDIRGVFKKFCNLA